MIILSKTIYCDKCEKIIKERDDLVTTTYLFIVVPYHEACYAKDLKTGYTLFLDNQPLNGFTSNLFFVLSILIGIAWAVIAEPSSKWISFITLIPISYRFYSYLTYERHIGK